MTLLQEYDRILAGMNHLYARGELARLKPEDASGSAAFDSLRQASHRFQEGLNRMLYEDSAAVRDLMLRYGVF